MNRIPAALALACLTCCDPVFADPARTYPATIVRVVDGDSLVVTVPAWADTPFATIAVRIGTIDAPESRMPPAKCKVEVALGKAATAFARTLAKPGDPVLIRWRGFDKYGGRIDGAVTLADGRDWAGAMLGAEKARPYAGKTKSNWCGGRR